MYLQLGSLGRPSPSRDYLAVAGGSVAPWPCPGQGLGVHGEVPFASVPKIRVHSRLSPVSHAQNWSRRDPSSCFPCRFSISILLQALPPSHKAAGMWGELPHANLFSWYLQALSSPSLFLPLLIQVMPLQAL